MNIHNLPPEDLDVLVLTLGIAPHALWHPTTNLEQARHLFFVILPHRYPGIYLEYHHYSSGHVRLIIAGRDYFHSETVNPGQSPEVAMTRLACLAANHFQNITSNKAS